VMSNIFFPSSEAATLREWPVRISSSFHCSPELFRDITAHASAHAAIACASTPCVIHYFLWFGCPL
jgi:hypothetical protein